MSGRNILFGEQYHKGQSKEFVKTTCCNPEASKTNEHIYPRCDFMTEKLRSGVTIKQPPIKGTEDWDVFSTWSVLWCSICNKSSNNMLKLQCK